MGPFFFCSHCRAAYRSSFVRCPLDGAHLRAESADPLIGTTIGEQYTIIDCIAYGATSRVYRAHHIRLQRRAVAIKVLLGISGAAERLEPARPAASREEAGARSFDARATRPRRDARQDGFYVEGELPVGPVELLLR